MLEGWIRGQGLRGNQHAVDDGQRLLRLHGEIPISSVPSPVDPEVIPQDILRAISEYLKGPLTPELVDTTWQTIWTTWGESNNHAFQVPPCDRTSEGLRELQKEGKAALLVPDEIYTKEGLVLLGGMFPKIRGWSVSGKTTVVNEDNNGGSIDIEMDIDSPNRDTNEEQAMDMLKWEGRKGQRFATFIIGSQFSKLLTRRYLDEGSTWSRLPGSFSEGYILCVHSGSLGGLSVFSGLDWKAHNPDLGFRSEGRKYKSRRLC